MESRHDWLLIFTAAFAFVMYVLTQVLSALATVPGDPAGWFPNTTEEISDKYPVQITPAGWTFLVWAVIYIWMLIYLVYILATLCRRNKDGPVYLNPPVVSATFLAVFAINLAFNITWLFLFSRAEFAWSAGVSCMLAFTTYVCLFLNYRAVEKHRDIMETNHKFDLWCNRVLIQNGLSVYATWTSIATLLNFSIVIVHMADVSDTTACVVSLSILTTELALYVIVDTFYWDRYLRYTLTVYITTVWALSGALAENWDPNGTVSIFTAVLLGLASACLVVKVLLVIFRNPIPPPMPRNSRPATTGKYALDGESHGDISMADKKAIDDVIY